MNFSNAAAIAPRDPLEALAGAPAEAAMAVITGVEGPSYRPVGACMALLPGGDRVGTLSSGCIESDIALQAARALQAGRPMSVRYGRGSPFIDIQLPCGGGLDILLVPRPDPATLAELVRRRAARRPCTLDIDADSGRLALLQDGVTGWDGRRFRVRHTPAVRFLIFGKGPESCTFAALVHSAGYPSLLLSPDFGTRDIAAAAGCPTAVLPGKQVPGDLAVDPWTAFVLFFHDHDWEPPLLRDALATPAFYIGAQGSQRARDARLRELEAMGVSAEQIARLSGPVGLIPSARDAGTLAVSVLAEVLAVAMSALPTRNA